MSMTQGRSNPWSTGAKPLAFSRRRQQTRRKGSGLLLRRPIEQRRARAGSWGSPASRAACGSSGDGRSSPETSSGRRRCSGVCGYGAAVAVVARSWHLQQLREEASMLDTTPGPFGCRGHVGGGRKRRRVRSSLVRSLRHARKRTERGETASSSPRPRRAGRRGRGGTGAVVVAKGISNGPRRKKGSGTSSRSSWRCLAWCRGRGGQGGDRGISRRASGGRW